MCCHNNSVGWVLQWRGKYGAECCFDQLWSQHSYFILFIIASCLCGLSVWYIVVVCEILCFRVDSDWNILYLFDVGCFYKYKKPQNLWNLQTCPLLLQKDIHLVWKFSDLCCCCNAQTVNYVASMFCYSCYKQTNKKKRIEYKSKVVFNLCRLKATVYLKGFHFCCSVTNISSWGLVKQFWFWKVWFL